MNVDIATVVGLALLPALGNFAGGILADSVNSSPKTLNRALHVATGIIIAVVAVEVMPKALEAAPGWALAVAFVLGGGAYLIVEEVVERGQSRAQGAGAAAWMVYVAVAADLVGDGLLIGAGAAISTSLAFVLALGQILADIPEGFAVNANFRDKGMPRKKRLWISASFAIPVLGAAVIAFFALWGRSDAVKMAALVFVAGLYALAAVEDMLREAHESAEDSRWSAVSFIAGFALLLLVSQSLG